MRNDSLQFVTFRYNSLHFVTLRPVTMRNDSLQFVTFLYNSLQFVTFRYNSLQFVTKIYLRITFNETFHNKNMTRTIHYCTFCDYKSDRRYDRDKHVTRKHGIYRERAPTNMTQPIHSSAAENRQHLTGYQVPQQGLPINGSGVLHTTRQYDPRVIPQVQYNELKHQGHGPQTSVNYSVSQKPKDTDNETDTETVSEADTEDQEEHDVYEI